jgi:hypothetical protein
MIRFFTTYYREHRPERRRELDLSLALNSLAFDQICVLSERTPGPGPIDCDWRISPKRQTYADILLWSSCVSGPDDVTVIANCDIVIPGDAARQISATLAPCQLFCLSRYEIHPTGKLKHFAEESSQDVWAFRGEPPKVGGGYFFGIPGCENTFARESKEAGWIVLNPSKTIKTIHIHGSRLRTDTNSAKHRLPPPYLFIEPTELVAQ